MAIWQENCLIEFRVTAYGSHYDYLRYIVKLGTYDFSHAIGGSAHRRSGDMLHQQ